MNEKTVINGPVYDARTLGTPKMLVLGLQHMFAMFGATILVPILVNNYPLFPLFFKGRVRYNKLCTPLVCSFVPKKGLLLSWLPVLKPPGCPAAPGREIVMPNSSSVTS